MILSAVVFLSGCIEKTLKPAVIMKVAQVSPYRVFPTGTGTSDLPTVDVLLTAQSGVPSKLLSYAVTYQTSQGQALPQLRIDETPMELLIAPSADTTITLPVYTSRVVDLFDLTLSDISPLKASIRLTIHDENNNTIAKEAHCLLYPPGTTSTE